jgi:hypothetical protein
MNACGSACADAACYSPVQPLSWGHDLARAARFHADEMLQQGFFAHNSICTLVPDIDDLYPASCDGSASCACVGGTSSCNPACTTWSQRIGLFGGAARGEIIASPSDPDYAFYLWLYEPTANPVCTFTQENGHRWLILTSSGAVGMGSSSSSVGDFGTGPSAGVVASGAHHPRTGTSVELWASFHDGAAPLDAVVNLDGTCLPMALARGSGTNGAWTATASGLPASCVRYVFEFQRSNGDAVAFPASGSYGIPNASPCPDWSASQPPSCLGSLFSDGFESGDMSRWSATCRAGRRPSRNGRYAAPRPRASSSAGTSMRNTVSRDGSLTG